MTKYILVLVVGLIFLLSEYIEWAGGRRENTATFVESLSCKAVIGAFAIMVAIVYFVTG